MEYKVANESENVDWETCQNKYADILDRFKEQYPAEDAAYPHRADAAEDEEVDVTSVDPIPAFCSSDEELEDYKALLYLPIAPEVEDPEENPFGPPPDATAQNASTDDGSAHTGPGDKKRHPSGDGAPPKKKIRTTTIELQGVPSDEVHPLLGVKGDSKSKKKAAGRPKGSKGNLVAAVYKQHEVQGLD